MHLGGRPFCVIERLPGTAPDSHELFRLWQFGKKAVVVAVRLAGL
jgi:hypothetical protein